VHPDDSLLKADDGALTERTIDDVADLCGIKASEVTASEVRRIPHAYVVYDLDYQKNRGAVYDYLDRHRPAYLRPLGQLRISQHGSVR
jgi:protoporphyrinogen oxidase